MKKNVYDLDNLPQGIALSDKELTAKKIFTTETLIPSFGQITAKELVEKLQQVDGASLININYSLGEDGFDDHPTLEITGSRLETKEELSDRLQRRVNVLMKKQKQNKIKP